MSWLMLQKSWYKLERMVVRERAEGGEETPRLIADALEFMAPLITGDPGSGTAVGVIDRISSIRSAMRFEQ